MSVERLPFRICVEAPAPGPRLAYALDVLCAWFGWSWYPATEHDLPSRNHAEALLAYGPQAWLLQRAVPDVRRVEIVAAGLLDDRHGDFGRAIAWGEYRGVACPDAGDPLAGMFRLLSLYGEYGTAARDAHGRVPADSQAWVREGFANVPLADRLAGALAQTLWHSTGRAGEPAWVEVPTRATSDLDAPTAFRARPATKRWTGLARGVLSDIRRGDVSVVRWAKWAAGARDPFDTFAFMADALARRGLEQDVFTLVGYGTRRDPGYGFGDSRWHPLWTAVAKTGRLGLHPSYDTSTHPELVDREKRMLERALDRPVTITRQHFLRLRVPSTLRALAELGFREEHSLMWAERAGFRTGSARAFPWYDLGRERETQLLLVPPHAMDVTARYREDHTPASALAQWSALAREARASGAGSRVIWHNSNLGDYAGWWPWRAAYLGALDLLGLDADAATTLGGEAGRTT